MTHAIDISKGERRGEVSAQWAMRPDDQKFLSLSDLRNQVSLWATQSRDADLAPSQLKVIASEDGLMLDAGTETPMGLTHYSFQTLARMAQAPANYLRNIDPRLAALNLNYGLRAAEQKETRLYIREWKDGEGDWLTENQTLRGMTSPRYGRILDSDVVGAVMNIAGNGVGDTRWKVPGTIDWGSAHGISYNPKVVISKQNTTLYASDRDIFVFLVDDMNPIEVGKLNNGDPDLMFRGFYVWNSEVGDTTFGLSTMYLRGVCQNRNLWGVEGFNELTFRHTSGAPERFMIDAAPALHTFTEGYAGKLVEGVKTAKGLIVSKTDEERFAFLAKFGFSLKQAKELIVTATAEEGRPQESIWDHAQAITALARTVDLQEDRLAMERVAGGMLDKVKV